MSDEDVVKEPVVYNYVGDGAVLIGVPKRDLTASDLELIKTRRISVADLVRSGLYKKARKSFNKKSSSDKSKSDD